MYNNYKDNTGKIADIRQKGMEVGDLPLHEKILHTKEDKQPSPFDDALSIICFYLYLIHLSMWCEFNKILNKYGRYYTA